MIPVGLICPEVICHTCAKEDTVLGLGVASTKGGVSRLYPGGTRPALFLRTSPFTVGVLPT